MDMPFRYVLCIRHEGFNRSGFILSLMSTPLDVAAAPYRSNPPGQADDVIASGVVLSLTSFWAVRQSMCLDPAWCGCGSRPRPSDPSPSAGCCKQHGWEGGPHAGLVERYAIDFFAINGCSLCEQCF